MTKNNTKQTPSSDGEFLDSPYFTEESTNLENEQENTPVVSEDVSLDNSTITISNVTSTKSTQKYEVVLSTDTKFVLDQLEQGGVSYSHTTYTKSLNFKAGDKIIIPKKDS